MGFSSVDSLNSSINFPTSNTFSSSFKKTYHTTGAVGNWHLGTRSTGIPVATTYPGTALSWVTCTETTGDGTNVFGMYHGGNVSPATKHVTNIMAYGTGVGAFPATLMLCDLQGYWPGISLTTTTAQSLGTITSLRYASGNGCFLVLTPTTAAGATASALQASTGINYTNSTGASGKTNPVGVALALSTQTGRIFGSNTAGSQAANYGPFIPLARGDTGVSNVTSITIQTSMVSGVAALHLVKPLLTIPIYGTSGQASERDYLNQLPAPLPRIRDDACLIWLIYAGGALAATSVFDGRIEFAWG
jgi:hypothetical protein